MSRLQRQTPVCVRVLYVVSRSVAECFADITESTAIPQPSKTSSASVSTASTSSVAAQATAVSDSSSTVPAVNLKRSNAIGGGVVGGLAALALVCGLAFWIYRRRRIARTNGAILNSPDTMSQHQTDTLASQPTIPVPSIVRILSHLPARVDFIISLDRLVVALATRALGVDSLRPELGVIFILRYGISHSFNNYHSFILNGTYIIKPWNIVSIQSLRLSHLYRRHTYKQFLSVSIAPSNSARTSPTAESDAPKLRSPRPLVLPLRMAIVGEACDRFEGMHFDHRIGGNLGYCNSKATWILAFDICNLLWA